MTSGQHRLARRHDELRAAVAQMLFWWDAIAPAADMPAAFEDFDSALEHDNRVAWAMTHMTQAGLLNRPQRGRYMLSERGKKVLEEHSERVDISVDLGQLVALDPSHTGAHEPPLPHRRL